VFGGQQLESFIQARGIQWRVRPRNWVRFDNIYL